MKKSNKKKLIFIPIIILFTLCLLFFMYVYSGVYTGDYTSQKDLLDATNVNIENTDYITFTPKDQSNNIGFIFYPGGKVTADAYAPLMKKISENGFKVIIPKMPFNLAVFSPNKADGIINKNPEIHTWVIGGHSLGGTMAASYAYNNPDKITGLIMYASYPQDKHNFKDRNISVLSLYGSEDGVASLANIENSKNLFPSSAVFNVIQGGNHGNFGNYGDQKGDHESLITREDQQTQTLKFTADFLNNLSN